MKNIKITTISILVLLQMLIILNDTLSWLVSLIGMLVFIGMFVWMNIEAFKIKNRIKKLVVLVDIVFGVLVLYAVLSDYYLLPRFMVYGYAGLYVSGTLLLLLEAAVLAVLIRAYKEE